MPHSAKPARDRSGHPRVAFNGLSSRSCPNVKWRHKEIRVRLARLLGSLTNRLGRQGRELTVPAQHRIKRFLVCSSTPRMRRAVRSKEKKAPLPNGLAGHAPRVEMPGMRPIPHGSVGGVVRRSNKWNSRHRKHLPDLSSFGSTLGTPPLPNGSADMDSGPVRAPDSPLPNGSADGRSASFRALDPPLPNGSVNRHLERSAEMKSRRLRPAVMNREEVWRLGRTCHDLPHARSVIHQRKRDSLSLWERVVRVKPAIHETYSFRTL